MKEVESSRKTFFGIYDNKVTMWRACKLLQVLCFVAEASHNRLIFEGGLLCVKD